MWTFALSDQAGVDLGDMVQVSARQVTFPLNRIPSVSFVARTDNPRMLDFLQADKRYVRVYDTSQLTASGLPTLRFCGPITQPQKTRDDNGGSISVPATGPGWRLGKRLLGKSKSGATYATALAPQDRGAIAVQMIADARLDLQGRDNDHGIRIGQIVASANTSIGPIYFTPALQQITNLSAALDGFDWEIAPIEPTSDAQGLALGTFNCAPVIGALRPDCQFEFGDGKRNVKAFTQMIDASNLCNAAYSLPQSFPDNAVGDVLSSFDETSRLDRGLYEDLVQTDVFVDSMRQKLADENVRVRRYPRQVINFTPTADDLANPGRVPVFGVDYSVGDIVSFRATEEGTVTVDAYFRIFQVAFAIDALGTATPTLTLVQDDTSS